jgi:predicted CXXCH cytochrome family protein
VLVSRYPWTWEGGTRREAQGGANINSGEARDFLLGGCATRMTCVACHDPHAPDNAARMRALDGPAGDAVCLRCHDKYRGADAQRAHSHHDPAGAGGRCIGCHMAKKNLSLEPRLGRYHRIGSPDDPARVERDRPLECAACHAGKGVEDLAATMERWWGKRYDRARLRELYGDDLSARPLPATIARGKPHEQAAAAAMLGEQGSRGDAKAIAPLLGHPIPIVRWYARAALTALAGPPPATLDLHASPSAIAEVAAKWVGGTVAAPARAAPGADPRSFEGED